MKRLRKAAFTLIELLIVIAVIAILAAIAVPNFLCAQTRTKASRTKSDLRTLIVALESYNVDKNAYPPDWDDLDPGEQRDARIGDGARAAHSTTYGPEDLYYLSYRALAPLTTPVSYLSSVSADPFSGDGSAISYVSFALRNSPDLPERAWLVAGMGPDNQVGQWRAIPGLAGQGTPIIYDTTNGCISKGDILRTNNVAWYPKFNGLHQ